MEYSQKLKDPRWQKRRLETLKKAGFACEHCGSKTETLHVHHGYYEKGKEPWEYLPATLRSLCKECHEAVREDEVVVRKLISAYQKNANWRTDLCLVISAVGALGRPKLFARRFAELMVNTLCGRPRDVQRKSVGYLKMVAEELEAHYAK